MSNTSPAQSVLSWIDAGVAHSARWQSEAGVSPPKRVVIADDTITADAAYRLACEGTALLWRGDYQNARQLLQAMARRIDNAKSGKKPGTKPPPAATTAAPTLAFHLHRQAQSQRARTLGMLLIPLNADYTIPLKRAPDVRLACSEAYGECSPARETSAKTSNTQTGAEVDLTSQPALVVSLRELLGLIGAHEWRKNGVEIPALGARIHPYYGVFSPVRGEYVQLLATAPLPAALQHAQISLAFDIGTGTGILAAVLAKRGIQRILATDQDSRALACAQDNLTRLGYAAQVELLQTDLFPPGRAPLVVCNPPWLPARPSSPIEYAIYDPDSRMLLGFLQGLKDHLTAHGEGWLILSDFAEHLGLRTREEFLNAIEQAGLKVLGKMDIKPLHPKTMDMTDALHRARAKEITSLWRLGVNI